MVLDSSVLIAMLLGEEESSAYVQDIMDADHVYVSAVSLVETAIVIENKKGAAGANKVRRIIGPYWTDRGRIRSSTSKACSYCLAMFRQGSASGKTQFRGLLQLCACQIFKPTFVV